MKYVHPFPARMAPEIVFDRLSRADANQIVLDPMCGSGMVLAQSAQRGVPSIGYDVDPLALLMSRVAGTRIDEAHCREFMRELIDFATRAVEERRRINLPWIDDDNETSEFVKFWFAGRQARQLRALSFFLFSNPLLDDVKIVEAVCIAISRLIITKEPRASLARDTSHSRPHKTLEENEFDIFKSLPASLEHVLQAKSLIEVSRETETRLGDSRNMKDVKSESIDIIVTSPPYLNAIDYMRGHRMSLIWFGYSIPGLRRIRASMIGTERGADARAELCFEDLVSELKIGGLKPRQMNILKKFYCDLSDQIVESCRVLKPGGRATYVIGNSSVRGFYIENNMILRRAAERAGLILSGETVREIPDGRRYLPFNIKGSNALNSRMRTEHVVDFIKPLAA